MLSDALHGSLDECCDSLVRAALSNGGVDNTTVVLVRILEA
jgi:serine/threonine protein phosphatase PrpC